MEENNDIFFAGDGALVYLAEPMYKKYSATFVWGNLFSTYVSYDRFFNPCTHLYTFWVTPSISPAAYIVNRWSVSQPKNK